MRPEAGVPEKARRRILLVLEDGEVFQGFAAGAFGTGGAAGVACSPQAGGTPRVATGELVFNTVMAGYQEVMTDPSYAGQVVAFTYPHIGNYGVNRDDCESRRAWLNGVVGREVGGPPSSWRAEGGLDEWLEAEGVPAITGVDTRRLVLHLRERGSLRCAFGDGEAAELLAAARSDPGTEGRDLVSGVTIESHYEMGEGDRRVVVYDFGVKRAMLEKLGLSARLLVVPAGSPAGEVLAWEPDLVFLSNGPGDPAALPVQAGIVSDLVGKVPLFGICLGHQILAHALGASTYKLRFGHHGGNHPVMDVGTRKVEITSQNHNYAVDGVSAKRAGIEVTHTNLNDGVVEGMRSASACAMSVQYHPEAAPGPHDGAYLFSILDRQMAGSGQ